MSGNSGNSVEEKALMKRRSYIKMSQISKNKLSDSKGEYNEISEQGNNSMPSNNGKIQKIKNKKIFIVTLC